MPQMSTVERLFCQSRLWRTFTRKIVLPWALQGVTLNGEVLEVGGGSGAMAAELLASFPHIRIAMSDLDPKMLQKADSILRGFGNRVTLQQADATALPFDNERFDQVVSFIMLHHVIKWEEALFEMCRVLKPGGTLVAYDLLNTLPMRLLHQAEGAGFRMMRFAELSSQLRNLPLEQVVLRRGVGGLVVRFRATRTEGLRQAEGAVVQRSRLRSVEGPAASSSSES